MARGGQRPQGIIRPMNPQDAPPQHVLTLPGAIALSPFRVEKLLAALPQPLPGTLAIDARFVHFVAVAQPLDAGGTQVLEKLLTYGTPAQGEPQGEPIVAPSRLPRKASCVVSGCPYRKPTQVGGSSRPRRSSDSRLRNSAN